MTGTLLHAEWTKFRTVRGWLIAAAAAALVIVLLALLTANGSHTESCINGKCSTGRPHVLLGPDGEEVSDSFYFMHQSLTGDGSITARITSLTGRYAPSGAVSVSPSGTGPAGLPSGVQPWTKAGVLIKASTAPGSRYAAMMITGTHGVRMQYDYTGDIAGPAGAVSGATPRWLRLTRDGDVLTGYESTGGGNWTRVGSTRLRGFPSTVQVGLFTASPDYSVTQDSFGSGGSSGGPSWATARFDHVDLQSANPAGAWRGADIGSADGPDSSSVGYQRAGATFVLTGSGDIAPVVGGEGQGGGQAIERTLVGAFAGLIVLIVVAALFVTGEYRRGLIRTTFAAAPGRGQVLAAKAAVVGAIAFVVGLAAAAVSMHLGKQILQNNGNAIYPVSTGTEVRVIVGTAALLAVGAVLAVAVGALLRRGSGAVTALVAATVLPYILATAHVLPTGASQWLLRLTPAAAFAVQQSVVRYAQVSADYSPSNGFFPLAPWAGFAVLCGYTALAFAAAVVVVRRRDV